MDAMLGGYQVLTLAAGGGGAAATAIAVVFVLGIGAQWIAWRTKLPSILLLLVLGFLAWPAMRAVFPDADPSVDPDALLGNLLLPLVGAAVGLILYEGGLTLKLNEIRGVTRVVTLLVSVGAVLTLIIAALAAWLVLGLSVELAVLLGAILVVTGPTVVGPLLGQIRPAGAVGPILKWEGIVIDPIGVLMAVLVFEAILIGSAGAAAGAMAWAIIKTIVVGGGLGYVSAWILNLLMNRYWIPDFLQNPFSLMLVIATFTASNAVQEESGLLATTVMGVVLANQTRTDVRHIVEFKENLRVLLISVLFIVLAGRVNISELAALDWPRVIAFLVVLIVVARPATVFVSTIGAGLSLRERVFMALLAPRGIVAAAGSSIFALGLEGAGVAEAGKLVPLTFVVIVGTVTFYGLLASPLSRVLGVSDQDPQGVLFIGAAGWVRSVAAALKKCGVRVLLVDANRANVRAALMAGLPAEGRNILAEHAVEALDLRGIGRAIAVTPNDEVNALALQRFREVFDRVGLYRLPTVAAKKGDKKGDKAGSGAGGSGETATRLGRALFRDGCDHATMARRVEAEGWLVKATTLSDEFSYDDYRTLYGPEAVTLFSVTKDGIVNVATADKPVNPSAGDTVIGLVNPDELLMPGPRMIPQEGPAITGEA